VRGNRGISTGSHPDRATAQSSTEETVAYNKNGATSYSSPSNHSAPVHFGLKASGPVLVRCSTEGQEPQGNHYWFRVGKDGRLGYVHRDAIAPGSDSIPHC
jgi:hypothetical protein